MTTNEIQKLIDIAVAKATKAALSGNPVERVVWIPPQASSESGTGTFMVQVCDNLTSADTPPWEMVG